MLRARTTSSTFFFDTFLDLFKISTISHFSFAGELLKMPSTTSKTLFSFANAFNFLTDNWLSNASLLDIFLNCEFKI